MFHFLPVAIRYDGTVADRGPRLPGAHRPDVRRHPRLGADPLARTRSSTRRCCSTTSRRPTTAGSGSRRSGSRATSSTSRPSRRTTTASSRPGPAVETDERDPRLGPRATPRPRCTPRARPRWASTRCRSSTRPSMRVHGARGPPRRRRLGLPLRHQRQHLRARDDGRREGRRPDPRQHPAARRPTCPYYRHRDGITALPARRQPQPRASGRMQP